MLCTFDKTASILSYKREFRKGIVGFRILVEVAYSQRRDAQSANSFFQQESLLGTNWIGIYLPIDFDSGLSI